MKTRILSLISMILFCFSTTLIFGQLSDTGPINPKEETPPTPSILKPNPRLLEKSLSGGGSYLLDVEGSSTVAKFGGLGSTTYLDFYTSISPDYAASLELTSNQLLLGTSSVHTDANVRISGGGANSNMYFGTGGGTTRMSITSVGDIGIGTTAPTNKLHVYNGAGEGGAPVFDLADIVIEDNDWAYLQINGGNFAGVVINDENNPTHAGMLYQYSNELLYFKTNNSTRLAINEAGNIGIGTTIIPAAYKLAIDGKMICEEAWVKNSSNWPDYVFTKEYDLPSLSDLEQQIQTLGHLPNIPSAAAVAEEGYALGDMQKRLLEKVEELTLYAIDADKKNKALETQLTETQTQLQVVQAQLQELTKALSQLKE